MIQSVTCKDFLKLYGYFYPNSFFWSKIGGSVLEAIDDHSKKPAEIGHPQRAITRVPEETRPLIHDSSSLGSYARRERRGEGPVEPITISTAPNLKASIFCS
ncbi:hypothetical protein Trydic_g55 [Trypoxylus dichotomus]